MLRYALLALALVAAPAVAGVEFATYEGPDAIQTGTGGAKLTKDGIDFWTVGTPPRRYQVLGFLTDTRSDKLLSGKAIGSSGLAKRVRDTGGNALIVLDRDKQAAGVVGAINTNGWPSWGRKVHEITTQFVVVRYLPN